MSMRIGSAILFALVIWISACAHRQFIPTCIPWPAEALELLLQYHEATGPEPDALVEAVLRDAQVCNLLARMQ